MGLLKVARAHVGATVGIAFVVLGGAGVATAAVVVTPAASSDEVFETPATTEPAATTTAEAVPTTDAPVSNAVEPPAAALTPQPRATVGTVNEPQIADPESIGTKGANGVYTPAPPKPVPGEPPVGVDDIPPPIGEVPSTPITLN